LADPKSRGGAPEVQLFSENAISYQVVDLHGGFQSPIVTAGG
jgi:hypothetical protein